ncbi:MAG: hypothetical protein U0Q15_12590 [Kineosporiaceae bacterium]
MRWRRRSAKVGGADRGELRAQAQEVASHLEEFVRSRVGVEAYVEPPTSVLPRTVVLVATDGEWTRRRVPDDAVLRHLADDLVVPVYDARITGYPQRMRDWTARRRAQG